MTEQLTAQVAPTQAVVDQPTATEDSQSLTWENLKKAVEAFVSGAARLLWIVLGVLVLVFILRDLSTDLVAIEPISVPKAFSESGYTPEVASRRLRDALTDYAIKADTMMQSPSIAPRDELPTIIVPKIDLSLDTLVSSIRGILHYGSRRVISGELIFRDKLTWLRLRIDGKQVYSSPNGFDPDHLDELFAAATPAVMEKIRPYLIAATIYKTDPVQASEKADDIIARLPETDINVHWSYVLKGNFWNGRKDYVQAEKAFRKAISLNEKNYAAHNNLGGALADQGKTDEAVVEYRRAIEIDPAHPFAHNGLGNVLVAQHKIDEAVAEYRRSIEGDPKNPLVHYNFAIALGESGKFDDEISEYRRAIKLDPKHSAAHNNLGVALRDQGKIDDAIEEFRRAVEADLNNRNAGDNLERALLWKANPSSDK